MSEDSYEKVIEGIDVVVGTISRLLFPLRIFSYGFDKAQDFLLTKLPEKLKVFQLKIWFHLMLR